MANKTIGAILNLKDNFSSVINKTAKNTKQFERQIKRTQNQAIKMKESVGNAFTGLKGKIAGALAGIGIAKFAKDSIMMASDLNEVQNVVDVTFGGMKNKINDFSKTAIAKFGLSELQAKQFSGTLGALMKSSGVSSNKLTEMSTSLTGLAGDFASFYNLPIEEAFEKIKSGISGETEPLKALGINMSVANMEAYALSKGIKKSWNAMSQSEQTLLRYEYLMKQSADAQGDFARTNTGFANKLRTVTEKVKSLGASLVADLIPHLEVMLAKFETWIDSVDIEAVTNNIKTAFQWLGDKIGWVKDNMNWLMPIAAGVVTTLAAFSIVNTVKGWLGGLTLATKLITTAQTLWNASMLSNPIGWVCLLIGGLIAAGVALYQNWDFVKAKAGELWSWLKEKWNGIKEACEPVTTWIMDKWNAVCGVFDTVKNKALELWNSIKEAWNSVKEFFGFEGDSTVTVNTPKVGKNALGTQYWRGGLTRVNERGGEIINLPNGSRVIPADKSEKILNNKSINVHVVIQGNVIGNEAFINQVGNTIANRINMALNNM